MSKVLSFLQYFCFSLSYRLSLNHLFYLFVSGPFRQVYCTIVLSCIQLCFFFYDTELSNNHESADLIKKRSSRVCLFSMKITLWVNMFSLNEHLHLRCGSYLHEQINLSSTHKAPFEWLTSSPSNNVACLLTFA